MNSLVARALALLFLITAAALHAQVPQLINYQGRVAVGAVNFEGSGAFKFALVNTNGTVTYWSNDGTSAAGSEPTNAVSLTVVKGLYSVLLGANMTAIPVSTWSHADVRLRVWFNDGTNGSQLLTPDQRIAPNGYLPDGAVTNTQLAVLAVRTANLASDLTLGGTTTGSFSGPVAGNATNVTGVVAIANGGTGSLVQNFVDLTTDQTSIGGTKTFTNRVNLGTSTSVKPLKVTAATGSVGIEHTDGTRKLQTWIDSEGAKVGTVTQDRLHLFAKNQGVLTVDYVSGGMVGINNSTPQYHLDVNGNAHCSGNLEVDNNIHCSTGLVVVGPMQGDSLVAPGNSQLGSVNVAGFVLAGAIHADGEISGGSLLINGAKNFRIDHPMDPANKYLVHSSIESPEVMNLYNGNITTDARGLATVDLPGYFETLNRDFRYQLTVIGQFAQVIVAQKIKGNRFVIQTDKPNVEVSWQVMGVRQDAWMKAHPVVVEQDKPADERGKYQDPALFGQPVENGIGWAQNQERMKRFDEARAKVTAVRIKPLAPQTTESKP